MANDELIRAYYINALLNKNNYLAQGGNLLNPSQTNINGLAAVDTSFNGTQPQAKPEEKKEASGFDQFMNNVLGFVDEMAAKFGAGFVGGWEGGLDLIATGLGALGWEDAAKWAKQDIGKAAAEWSKTAFGLGAWYNRFRNWDWNKEEWQNIGESWADWNKAAFFANNEMKDVRSELTDKYYKGRDDLTTGFGQFLGGAAYSIGMMLPSIMTAGSASAAGAGQLAVKATSLATLGLGAAGKGSEEALNDGATAGQALGYGVASGAVEVASEIVVGKALGKLAEATGLSKYLGEFGRVNGVNFSKEVIQKATAKQLVTTMVEEGAEEVFSDLFAPICQSIYKGSDALKQYGDKEYYKEMALSFASGAFVGGLTEGVQSASSYAKYGKAGVAYLENNSEMQEAWKAYKENPNAETEQRVKDVANQLVTQLTEMANDPAEKKHLENLVELFTGTNSNKSLSERVAEMKSELSRETYQKLTDDINRAFSETTGTQFEWAEASDFNEGERAYYDKASDTVVLNKAYKNEAMDLIKHEGISHAILDASPDIRAKLIKAIESDPKLKELYHKYDKELEEQYSEKKLESERLATFTESLLKDFNNVEKLIKRNYYTRSKLARILSKIENNLKGVKGFDKTFIKSVEKAIAALQTKAEAEVKTELKKTKEARAYSKYLFDLKENKNNEVVEFKSDKSVKNAFEEIIKGDNRIGYLVINDFSVSNEIAEKLNLDNDLALVISKGKIKSIHIDHNITADQFVSAIKKAATSPEAIVYDNERKSYQFYVEIKNGSYRAVIEFDTVPKGMKNVKADVLTTLFQNDNYEKRIKGIEENRFPELSLKYEKKGGWALVATDLSNNNIPNNSDNNNYSKDLVTGKYTVGDNKQPLEVRKTAKGYEVYFPKEERYITRAEVGGEWAKNEKGIEVRNNGEEVTFDTAKNVQRYLDDIGAKKVEKENYTNKKVGETHTFESEKEAREYLTKEGFKLKADKDLRRKYKGEKYTYYVEQADGKYNIKKVVDIKPAEPTINNSLPTEQELKKADQAKLKKVSIPANGTRYLQDGTEYRIKKIGDGLYKVNIKNTNGEITEKTYTYKALKNELNSFTLVGNKPIEAKKPNNKSQLFTAKTVQGGKLVNKNKFLGKEIENGLIYKLKAEPKEHSYHGFKGNHAIYDKDSGLLAAYANSIEEATKMAKSPKFIADLNKSREKLPSRLTAQTEQKAETKKAEAKTETKTEAKKSETKVEKAEKPVKTKAEKTFKSMTTTREIIDSAVSSLGEMLGKGYKARVPVSMEDFTSRTFSDINEVQDTDREANRLTQKLLEIKVERENGEYVGDLADLLDNKQIIELNKLTKKLIETSPNEKARSAATRSVEIMLNKAMEAAKEAKNGKGRVRVLVRLRDRIRRRINRFTSITNNEIIKNGLNLLYDPFEQLHGKQEDGFGAKGYAERLQTALNWYTEENVTENFEGLVYNDVIRKALEDIYDSLGYGVERGKGTVYKNLSTETMQKSIEAIRLINETVTRMEQNHINKIRPASLQTIIAMKRAGRGNAKNPLARLLRMYKRGFAPSYAVIEEIFGGDSAIAKTIVTDIQNAINSKALYTGIYHDDINKQLKELGIKKTFDTKKVNVHGVEMSVDQAMGLYISLNVQANYDAINQDGAAIYDSKYNRTQELVGKNQAETLKSEISSALPDNYKKFADYLLKTMNSKVKANYIEWYEKHFGKYAMRNEIGVLNDTSYWTLARSYQKMTNLTKSVSNPAALFTNAKHRTNGGQNEVLITGALSTFNSYIDKLGRELYIKDTYNDIVSMMNTKGTDGKSVMDYLNSGVDSAKDTAYVKETLADILGVKTRDVTLLDKMVSAFSVAKLSLNLGSMLKQWASIYTSNIPIRKSAKALINEMFNSEAKSEFKTLVNEIGGLKYREAGAGVIEANADSVTGLTRKIAKAGMLGISKIDLFTVSTGVYSLMVIGQDQYGYKIGSKENIDFVKEHWNEFELSQIGNSALSKNYISRSSDSLVRYLFGFLQGANRAALGSQIHKWGLFTRNKNVDIKQLNSSLKTAKETLETAKAEYEADPDNEAARNAYIEAQAEVIDLDNRIKDYQSFKIAGGKAIPVNMAAGILAQGILVALVNSLMKRIKGRKDWDEFDIEEEAMALVKSTAVDWLPFVNFISNIMQGYEVDIPAINLFNQFSEIFKSANGQDWRTMIKQCLLLVGDMTGIPFQTLYQYVYGTVKAFDPSAAYEMRSVLYGSSVQSATKTMQTYAQKGNVNKTADMIDLIMQKFKTGSTTDEINKELATLYIAGFNAIPKTSMTSYTNEDGEVVKLTSEQITQFNNLYGQSTKDVSALLKLTDYKNMTQEEKAKAIKKIYDIYYAYAKARITGEKPEGKLATLLVLTNGNIDTAKYILSLQKIGSITDTNKKTRKELVIEYINKLRGYSKAEKTLLMYLAGYSVSGTSHSQLINYLTSKGANRKQVLTFIPK